MPYTSVPVTNYNSNPPPDDGSTASINQLTWAAIKTKLADPLKTAIEAINSGVDTAVSTLETAFFEAGTKMVFVQTAAPSGWTKVTSAAFNDAAVRLVNGTAGTGGSVAFTSAFTDRTFTISQANLPSLNFTHSLTAASHTHAAGSLVIPAHWGFSGSAAISTSAGGETFLRAYGVGGEGPTVYVAQQAASGSTGSSGALAVTGTVASGGSGSSVSLNFAVKYVDVITATRDA